MESFAEEGSIKQSLVMLADKAAGKAKRMAYAKTWRCKPTWHVGSHEE